MEIRKAVVGDLKRIQELKFLLYKKEYEENDKSLDLDFTFSKRGEEVSRKYLAGGNFCVFVVEDEGKIIGYLTGKESEMEAYRNVSKLAELSSMFVLEEYRGKGVGGMLYDVFVGWCKGRGVKVLRVAASAGNEEAIGFYRKCGFEDYALVLEREI